MASPAGANRTFGNSLRQFSNDTFFFPSTPTTTRVIEEEVEEVEEDNDSCLLDTTGDEDECFLADLLGQGIGGEATLTKDSAAATSSFFAPCAHTGTAVAQYQLLAKPSKEHSLRRGLLLAPRRKRSSATILAATLPETQALDDNDKLLEALADIADTFTAHRPDTAFTATAEQHQQTMQLKQAQHTQIQQAAAQVAAAQQQLVQQQIQQGVAIPAPHRQRSSTVAVQPSPYASPYASPYDSPYASPYASPRSSAGSFAGFEAELSKFAATQDAGGSGVSAASSVSPSPSFSPYGSPYGSPRGSFSVSPRPGSAGPIRRQRSGSPHPRPAHSISAGFEPAPAVSVVPVAAGMVAFEAAAAVGGGGGGGGRAYYNPGAVQHHGHLVPLDVSFANPQMLEAKTAAAYKEADGTWSTILSDLPTIELNAFLKRCDFTKEETLDLKKVRRQRKNQVYTKRSRDRRSAAKSAKSE